MGIDLGIRKIAMSAWDDDKLLNVRAFEATKGNRMDELFIVGGWAAGMAEIFQIERVFIEDGVIGNNRKYSIALAQTNGAVQFALADLGKHLEITMCNISSWKKDVVGSGRADKHAITSWLEQTYPAYAAQCGSDQDQRDAVCIGLYGRSLLTRAVARSE